MDYLNSINFSKITKKSIDYVDANKLFQKKIKKVDGKSDISRFIIKMENVALKWYEIKNISDFIARNTNSV